VSSKTIPSDATGLYAWTPSLRSEDYLFATYRIATVLDPHRAAIGMAAEQSVNATSIQGFVTPEMVEGWTIRVRRVTDLGKASGTVQPFLLFTDTYHHAIEMERERACEVELAYPLRLFSGKPNQLFNSLIGELPRLGFLTQFQLASARLPNGVFGSGPAFGRQGILDRLGQRRGPLLCRAMRPAMGLDLRTMGRLNYEVLRHGFHLVKDDELQVFASNDDFRNHVSTMVDIRDRASRDSGERKGYICTLLCEPAELAERWEIAKSMGVDGVLVAPFIQGLGTLASLAAERSLPILAHNTFSELLSRYERWGIEDAVLFGWLRNLGADWTVTPPYFGEPHSDSELVARVRYAAGPERDDQKPAMLIMQGGKHPEELPLYLDAAGGADFMLIVASWVDRHPLGLVQGVREFRTAIDSLGTPASAPQPSFA
jgi:ribulose 1,5-bisphosphate carboxylase large subunit-like protein